MFNPNDRKVEFPERYRLDKVSGTDSIFDLVPAPGSIDEEGTVWNKRAAQLLQADRRIYKAGKDITAGEVLDVQDDETLNKTVTEVHKDQSMFVTSTSSYSRIKDFFKIGNKYHVFIESNSSTYSELILRIPQPTKEGVVSSANFADGIINICRTIILSDNTFAILFNGKAFNTFDNVNSGYVSGIHLMVISIDEDKFTLISKTKIADTMSNSNLDMVKINDTSICVVSVQNTAPVYYPTAYIVDGIGSTNPAITKSFDMDRASSLTYINQLRISTLKDNLVFVLYNGYNDPALCATIIDLNSEIFLPEILLGAFPYRELLTYSKFVEYSNKLFILSESSTSPYKLLIQEITTDTNEKTISISENKLENELVASGDSANSGISVLSVSGNLLVSFGESVYLIGDSTENLGSFVVKNQITLNKHSSYKWMSDLQFLEEGKADEFIVYGKWKNTSGSSSSTSYDEQTKFFYLYNGQFNVYHIISASQCISLQDANKGEDAEVIFDGIAKLPGIKEADSIFSPGVYGVGILDDVIQVWRDSRPGNIFSGSYVGTGEAGPDKPVTLIFPKPIKMIMIQSVENPNDNHHNEGTFISGATYGKTFYVTQSSNQTSANPGIVQISWESNSISFWSIPYSSNSSSGITARAQLNEANVIYKYVVIS